MADTRKNQYPGECSRCGCHVKSERGTIVQKVSQAYLDAVRYDVQFDVSAHFEEKPVWLIVCNTCSEKATTTADSPAKQSDVAVVYEQKAVAEDFHCLGCGCRASHGFHVQTKAGSQARRCDKCCGK